MTLITACTYFVSWDDYGKSWIGHRIDEVVKLEGPPDAITPLGNGGKEYKYHLKKIDPTCIHYWIIDPQGIIRGYHYKGRCRPIG